MKAGLFDWINTAADFIVYLLKEIFSITISVFIFVFHFVNKLFWYLLAAYPTGSKVVLALLAIFVVVFISYPRATIDLLGYIYLGRFFKDNSSKKVPFSARLLVEQTPEESLMGKEDTLYKVAPMETEEFLIGDDLSYVRSHIGEDFAKLKVDGQKKKFAVYASKWKEFATTHKAILDFFYDFSYFPSAEELYFLEKNNFPLRDRWGNNVGVYTKNVPHMSRAKFDMVVKRMKILDNPNGFLRECYDICRKGKKNSFGICEGDHNFKYEMQILASRHGFLLD